MGAVMLESARAKLVWSEHHRQQLIGPLRDYVRSGPIELSPPMPREIEGGRRVQVSWHVKRLEPIPQRWALIAGDAIQNARNALDHAIWELVVAAKGEQFAIDHFRDIQFPILEPGRRLNRGRTSALGLTEAVLDVVEAQQPDQQQQRAPEEDPLYVLWVLSNVDKHRLVHLVHLVASDAQVITKPRLFSGSVSFPNPDELRLGDEAVRFEALLPIEEFPITFDLLITSDIVIGKTPQTRPVAIEIGIRLMQSRVAEILDSLAAACN